LLSFSHAEGSAAELETQLIIAGKLDYCAQADIEQLLEQVLEMRKMLNALRRKLVKIVST
jgi:four helix bundle protein